MDAQLQQIIELQTEQNQLLKKYLWRFRFSLITLLLLTTAICCCLGFVIYTQQTSSGAAPKVMKKFTTTTPTGEVTKTTTPVGDGVYGALPKPIPANLLFPMDD